MAGFRGRLLRLGQQVTECKALIYSMRSLSLKSWMESSKTIDELFPTKLLIFDDHHLREWAIVHWFQWMFVRLTGRGTAARSMVDRHPGIEVLSKSRLRVKDCQRDRHRSHDVQTPTWFGVSFWCLSYAQTWIEICNSVPLCETCWFIISRVFGWPTIASPSQAWERDGKWPKWNGRPLSCFFRNVAVLIGQCHFLRRLKKWLLSSKVSTRNHDAIAFGRWGRAFRWQCPFVSKVDVAVKTTGPNRFAALAILSSCIGFAHRLALLELIEFSFRTMIVFVLLSSYLLRQRIFFAWEWISCLFLARRRIPSLHPFPSPNPTRSLSLSMSWNTSLIFQGQIFNSNLFAFSLSLLPFCFIQYWPLPKQSGVNSPLISGFQIAQLFLISVIAWTRLQLLLGQCVSFRLLCRSCRTDHDQSLFFFQFQITIVIRRGLR